MHGVVEFVVANCPGIAQSEWLAVNFVHWSPKVDDGPAMLAVVLRALPRREVVVQTTLGSKIRLINVDETSRKKTAIGHGHVWFVFVFVRVDTFPLSLADDVGDDSDITGTITVVLSVKSGRKLFSRLHERE